MDTNEELKLTIAELKEKVAELKYSVAELSIELTAVISRFLTKLSSGGDIAEQINELNFIKQEVININEQVTDSKNQAKIEGL